MTLRSSRVYPAASGKASDPTPRPGPIVIERPEAQPAGLGALLRPLAAGLIGGLLGGGLLALLLAGGGPKPDDQARLQIKELQDKIREQQDKTAQLSDTVRVKLAAPVKAASPEELDDVRSRIDDLSKATKAEDKSVQSLSQKVQALEQKPAPQTDKEAVQAEIASQMAPVTERLTGLEHTQNEKASEVADRLAGIERSQSEKASDGRAAAVAIALKNLERAVTEGKPFATELNAIEELSSEKLPVSELASYKETGVPRSPSFSMSSRRPFATSS